MCTITFKLRALERAHHVEKTVPLIDRRLKMARANIHTRVQPTIGVTRGYVLSSAALWGAASYMITVTSILDVAPKLETCK
jgi:hypothetical protein